MVRYPVSIPADLANSLTDCYFEIAKQADDIDISMHAYSAVHFFVTDATFASSDDYHTWLYGILLPCARHIADINIDLGAETTSLLVELSELCSSH